VLIFGIAIIAAVAGFVYLTSRVYRLLPTPKILVPKSRKYMRMFIATVIVLIVVLAFAALLGYVNAAVLVIHLMVFWLLADLLFFIIKKISGLRMFRLSSCVAVVTSLVYLVVGYVLANNVWVTNYDIHTEKAVGDLRIVMFADSHVGTTFDGEEFGEYVKEMQSYDPDIVVIAGDFVDDDTSLEDMKASCRALGTLKTTYGVFYSFGNHDKGYYGNSGRGYSGADLIAELKNNGVTVLQDEIVYIDGRFAVVGRQDKSEDERGEGRAEISDLVNGIDKSLYTIVIDHQPNDYDNESKAGVDLVLSGHTHGGQMFPIGLVSDIFKLNDRIYGTEKRGETSFIVTSGISDWAFKFKIGCKSEFVVIDVHGK
ncbi:MAG: metallophosphoesterase, partial [Clostridiales bacterium]|nr:metallophosphoesterase [Clostridiales bacterium]